MLLPIGAKKLNSGFTLIEILLVLIIVGIALGLAALNLSKGFARFELNQTVNDLLSLSRWAQSMAIGQERTFAISFSLDRHAYILERAKSNDDTQENISFEPVKGRLGLMHVIPSTISLDTHDDRIEFYPDGTIDPSSIQLETVDQKVVLSSTAVRGIMTQVASE